jgi:hypothetical protein
VFQELKGKSTLKEDDSGRPTFKNTRKVTDTGAGAMEVEETAAHRKVIDMTAPKAGVRTVYEGDKPKQHKYHTEHKHIGDKDDYGVEKVVTVDDGTPAEGDGQSRAFDDSRGGKS